MKAFLRQQVFSSKHQKPLMFVKSPHFKKLFPLFIVPLAIFLSGCFSPTAKVVKPRLLEVSNATQPELESQINSLAKINSIKANMMLQFEDNSYAELGIAKKYKRANTTIVVQRPAKINLKVALPVVGWDIAKMTSDGEKFRVAVLYAGGDKKPLSFVRGTNNVDYSVLSKKVVEAESGGSKEFKQNVSAFSKLRPQHFTDALLLRPTDTSKYLYVKSSIVREEFDITAKKKSPIKWVLRGYYLLDEYEKLADGKLAIKRRFWFDRVGGINLSRQQIFDKKGEIESDIVYGKMASMTAKGNIRMPLEIALTRPKEKYKVRLIHAAPRAVTTGKEYKDRAFLLENTTNLREIDLDKQLLEFRNGKTSPISTENKLTNKR